ncbi:hypothetical protein AFK68_23595 [Hydrocoleum sp. CS-953]|uniref:hypothetical protein n=1 Tax=Hydrocoleum sp. CS-953 TaxID=1671698 RepID=UPI000B9AECF3|nr:hypothetical protein [Hydrocoleum sp. CS-953]OZH52560.1 hypothetical protein AFK68_23595 [Hydrocoleum sp. CS-953]
MAKSFQLRLDVDEWFSNINKGKTQQIKTDFDLYYFCLMMGLATKSKNNPSERCKCRDFIDYFVSDYQSQQNLIIGLLIRAELENLGISLDEKDAVKKQLLKLINPSIQTNLTDEGIDKMNAYASGVFDYLIQKFSSKPNHLENFLQRYVKILREAIDGR